MIVFCVLLIAMAAPAAADSLTTTRVVRPNSEISVTDVTVIDTLVPGALDGNTDIVGLESKVTLYPGRPIMPDHVGPAAIVERNQTVRLTFHQGPLTIFTDARALSRGAVGETVRVMNLASKNTVFGQVTIDGSVEVFLE